MNELVYEEPPDATFADVRAAVAADEEPLRVSQLLVGLTFHEPDWRGVQELCLEILASGNPGYAYAAVLCLGHVARIHGRIDRERVIPAITAHQDDAKLRGRVQLTLEDIDWYAPEPGADR
jgi:hypothetical protein